MSANYKKQLFENYQEGKLNEMNGKMGELILADYLSTLGWVRRTERQDKFSAVDMFFKSFEQPDKELRCQCKTALRFNKIDSWSVPFNKTGLGIDRFLSADLSYIISTPHTIPNWKKDLDGHILLVNTKKLGPEMIEEIGGSKSLRIPRSLEFLTPVMELNESDKNMLKILSSSEYTY